MRYKAGRHRKQITLGAGTLHQLAGRANLIARPDVPVQVWRSIRCLLHMLSVRARAAVGAVENPEIYTYVVVVVVLLM